MNSTHDKRHTLLLQMLGLPMLSIGAVFVIIRSNWGFLHFFDAVDQVMAASQINSARIIGGQDFAAGLARNFWFSTILNTVAIVVLVVAIAVSIYKLLGIFLPKHIGKWGKYIPVVVGVVVLGFSSYEVIQLATTIYSNAFPTYEGVRTIGEFIIDRPFLHDIVLRQDGFYLRVIPYIILCAVRAVAGAAIGVWLCRR